MRPMTKLRCACGDHIARARFARHRASVWCRRQADVQLFLTRGLSHAEIARQLGVSRAWVNRKLNRRKP